MLDKCHLLRYDYSLLKIKSRSNTVCGTTDCKFRTLLSLIRCRIFYIWYSPSFNPLTSLSQMGPTSNKRWDSSRLVSDSVAHPIRPGFWEESNDSVTHCTYQAINLTKKGIYLTLIIKFEIVLSEIYKYIKIKWVLSYNCHILHLHNLSYFYVFAIPFIN